MTVVLRLRDMIFLQKGGWSRRAVHIIITLALRLFFRRIEANGTERVPLSGGLIFVLNHPNGLIDPGMVFVAMPRRVSFLAKSTLFDLPVIGSLMRTIEALPLYRRVDEAEDPAIAAALNQRTFAACHALLREGRCIAVFPEGVSHNATQLLPVKTGAARIALGALSVKREDSFSLKIVPVGLYYTSKTSFRSEALLRFGEPFEVLPVELDRDGQPPREAVHELSDKIAEKLREVTLNVEDDEALETVKLTEQLFSSVYETINFRQTLSDELDLRRNLARKLENYNTVEPEKAEDLKSRIAEYEKSLRELNITSEHLSVSRYSLWYVFRHFLLRLGIIIALSPVVIIGTLLHLPAYLLCILLARIFRRHGVDESGGTIKILAAILLMPLTWIAISLVVFFFWNWQAALFAFPLVIIFGYTALRSLEEMIDMRGWYKAAFVLARNPKMFIKLLRMRRLLHREIASFGNA